jgi:hypothetical protein
MIQDIYIAVHNDSLEYLEEMLRSCARSQGVGVDAWKTGVEANVRHTYSSKGSAET